MLPPDVAKTKDRGLTSTQDVAYTNDNTVARLHSETIPTSTLASTARVVDGFVTTQTATDGRGNTATTHTDLAGRPISSTARHRWGGGESTHPKERRVQRCRARSRLLQLPNCHTFQAEQDVAEKSLNKQIVKHGTVKRI